MSAVSLYSPPPRKPWQCPPVDFDSLLELVRQAHSGEIEALRAELDEALGVAQQAAAAAQAECASPAGRRRRGRRLSLHSTAKPPPAHLTDSPPLASALEAEANEHSPIELSPPRERAESPACWESPPELSALPLAADREPVAQVDNAAEVPGDLRIAWRSPGELKISSDEDAEAVVDPSPKTARRSLGTLQSIPEAANESAESCPTGTGEASAGVGDGSSSPLTRTSRRIVSFGSNSLSEAATRLQGSLITERRASQNRGVQTRALCKLVNNPWFEVFFAVCITLNCCLVAAEVQYRGLDMGFTLSHTSAHGRGEALWPWAEDLFNGTRLLFGFLFLAELILKVVGLRREFPKDPWNWIDSGIVGIFVVDLLSADLGFNTQVFRLLRLTRLFRLFRLFRFVKRKGFDSLYVMVAAVMGSHSILLWAIVALLVGHVFVALIMSQLLFTFYFQSVAEMPSEGALEVYTYYGTFSRALLTMFEITLANWPPACRLLVENVSEWFILYAIAHKLTIGFAVIGVINGVLIQETFKVVGEDDAIMVNRAERDHRTHVAKMTRLFEATASSDGWIGMESFKSVCKDKWVKSWLLSMGLDASDPEGLYALLDDGDGRLTVDELVAGVGRLKGPARSVDMMILKGDLHRLTGQLAVDRGSGPRPPARGGA